MLRFAYRTYRRPFRRSLHTAHGRWSLREGLLVRLSRGKIHRYGEIAPLPWFGSETLEQAIALCAGLPPEISLAHIRAIPQTHPACRFGLESAWELIQGAQGAPYASTSSRPASAYLLPTGADALSAWATPWQRGYRTFKWKIGAAETAQELALLQQLMAMLPAGAALRLDANGGLTQATAIAWLNQCDRLAAQSAAAIDCLEQPLPPSRLSQMLALQRRYQTPLALDESVATVAQLEQCLQAGWRGAVVVKAAIAGFPSRLRQICQRYRPDVIWSSVFETAAARAYIFDYLVAVYPPRRSLGFGVDHWFADGLEQGHSQKLWSRLSPPP